MTTNFETTNANAEAQTVNTASVEALALTPADADAIAQAYIDGRILTEKHVATLLHLRNLLRFLCETASHTPQKGVLVSALMLLETTFNFDALDGTPDDEAESPEAGLSHQ